MKHLIYPMILAAVMTSAGCASMSAMSDKFSEKMAAADERRAEKQEAKKLQRAGGLVVADRNGVRSANAGETATYLKAKQNKKDTVDTKAPVAAVVEEKMLAVKCSEGVVSYVGDNTIEVTSAGIVISKHENGNGTWSDFYYHADLDIVIEKVFNSGDFGKIKDGQLINTYVHIIDTDRTGTFKNAPLTFKAAVENNKTIYGQICNDGMTEIGADSGFIRSGYLRQLAFKDVTSRDDSERTRQYQFDDKFKAIVVKHAGYATDPIAIINRLLDPTVKAKFYGDILAYLKGAR